jgi:PAS domain-containing protein
MLNIFSRHRISAGIAPASRPPGPEGAPRRRMALRAATHIIVLIVACLLPMLGIAVLSISMLADAEREARNAQILSTTRVLAAAVDARLKIGAAQLSALATSSALREDDIPRFYEKCRSIASPGVWIILSDPNGEPLFTTRLPLGTPMSTLRSADLVKAAARSRSVQISDVFTGGTLHLSHVSVYVPVIEHGEVTRVLVMSFSLNEISDALLEQHLPAIWVASVIDHTNLVVARSQDVDVFGATTANRALIDQAAAHEEAFFNTTDRAGTELLVAFTKSRYSGWTVAMEMPAAELAAPFKRSLFRVALAAAAILVLGIIAAGLIGRRLASAMARLSSAALALGSGTPVREVVTVVSEVNEVGRALKSAADVVRRQSQERDEAEARLRHSEQRFRDIAEISGDWVWELGPDLRFTFHEGNHAGREHLALGEVIGRTPWELLQVDPRQDPALLRHQQDLEAHRPFRRPGVSSAIAAPARTRPRSSQPSNAPSAPRHCCAMRWIASRQASASSTTRVGWSCSTRARRTSTAAPSSCAPA